MTIDIGLGDQAWVFSAVQAMFAALGIAVLVYALVLLEKCRAEVRAWRRQRAWEQERGRP